MQDKAEIGIGRLELGSKTRQGDNRSWVRLGLGSKARQG